MIMPFFHMRQSRQHLRALERCVRFVYVFIFAVFTLWTIQFVDFYSAHQKRARILIENLHFPISLFWGPHSSLLWAHCHGLPKSSRPDHASINNMHVAKPPSSIPRLLPQSHFAQKNTCVFHFDKSFCPSHPFCSFEVAQKGKGKSGCFPTHTR